MVPGLFDSTNIPVLQEVLSFAASRHHVLAGNVANVDTPGYRVRDLSVETFQERLQDFIHSQDGPSELTSPGRVGYDPRDPLQHVRESMKSIQYLDDSDVGMEQQVTEIAKNQFMYNLAVAIMNSQFRLLQAAISERV
jgi:flagellar basal-body rod protein FlgB